MKKLAAVLVTASVLLGSAVALARTPSILKLILSVLTPNMNMNLPNPSSTLGPAWASQLNAALQVVDAHNHTPGNGVKVPTGGININADLPVNGFVLADAGAVQFVDQGSTLPSTKKGLVYDSGGNLWFNDGAGNAIQLTGSGGVIGGNVCGSPGGCTIITPASFKTAGGTQVCSIDNSGNLSCSGSGTFATGLNVSANGATIAGPVNLNAALTNTSSANVNTLTVGGAAQLDGGVNCTFNVTNAGSVVFSADCSGALTALSGATFGGQVNMGGNRITNLGSAVLGNDAVTLGQLLDGGGAFIGSQNSCVFYVLFPDAGGAGLMLYADCSGNVGVPNGLWVDGGTVLGHGLESVANAQFDANTLTKGVATVAGEIFANNQPDSLQGVNIKIPDGVTANVWGRLTNGPISDHTLRIMENGFFDAGSANKWCEDDNTDPLLVENVSAALGTWSWNHLPAGACASSVTSDAKLGTNGTLTLANQLLSDGGVVVNGEVDAVSAAFSGLAYANSVSIDGGIYLRQASVVFGGVANQGLFWDAGSYPDGGGIISSVTTGSGDLSQQASGFFWSTYPTTSCTYLGVTTSASANYNLEDDGLNFSTYDSAGVYVFNHQTVIQDGFGFAYTPTCGAHYSPDIIALVDGGIFPSVPITSPPAINSNQLATLGQVNAAVVGSFAGSVYIPGNLAVDGGTVFRQTEFVGGMLAMDAGARVSNGDLWFPGGLNQGLVWDGGAAGNASIQVVTGGGASGPALSIYGGQSWVVTDGHENNCGSSVSDDDISCFNANGDSTVLQGGKFTANVPIVASPAVLGSELATLNQVNAAVTGSFTGSIYVPGQLVVDGGERIANNIILTKATPNISDTFGDNIAFASNALQLQDVSGDQVTVIAGSAIVQDSAADSLTLHAGLASLNAPLTGPSEYITGKGGFDGGLVVGNGSLIAPTVTATSIGAGSATIINITAVNPVVLETPAGIAGNAAQLGQIYTVIPFSGVTADELLQPVLNLWQIPAASHVSYMDYNVQVGGTGTASANIFVSVFDITTDTAICSQQIIANGAACSTGNGFGHKTCGNALTTGDQVAVVVTPPSVGCSALPNISGTWTVTYP